MGVLRQPGGGDDGEDGEAGGVGRGEADHQHADQHAIGHEEADAAARRISMTLGVSSSRAPSSLLRLDPHPDGDREEVEQRRQEGDGDDGEVGDLGVGRHDEGARRP
jgi:hypothetical protein